MPKKSNPFLLSDLPHFPGIYKMLDGDGEVIYVGKAKNLKKRVSSYFKPVADRDLKTRILVSHIVSFETIVTRTEDEALILERQLIRSLQPRYNIDLKDDKNYPFIRLTTHEPFPKLSIVRYRANDQATYFGPFPSAGPTRYLQRLLLEIFPLRDCKQPISLTHLEPKCIKLDLGTCLGPCVLKSTKPDYDLLVTRLCQFLRGKQQAFLHDLKQKMRAYAEDHQYEKAAKLRDSLHNLQALVQRQAVHLKEMAPLQIWVLSQNVTHAYALVQTFVEGKLLYQNGFYESRSGPITDDFFERAILHFYNDQNPGWIKPQIILCDPSFFPYLSRALGQLCRVHIPQRNEKAEALKVAQKNAQLALLRILPDKADPGSRLLAELQQVLSLPTPPEWIWCIDISHFQGEDIVGALAVFHLGKPHKASYRKFLIRSVQGESHDPQSIYEVVFRQVSKLSSSSEALLPNGPSEQFSPSSFSFAKPRQARNCPSEPFDNIAFSNQPLPNLIVIDGGKGQLRFACQALSELGATHLPIIALAKKFEDIYFPNQSKPLKLKHHLAVLQLLKRVRNEAHRFAITFQRQRRKKRLITALDHIKGLGSVRLKALYSRYKTIDAMADCAPDIMAASVGLSHLLAEEVVSTAKRLVRERTPKGLT